MVTSCADKTDNIKIEKKMEKIMTTATIKTNLGDIQLELNDEKAPITVENFKKIAASGYCLLYTSPSPRDSRRSRMPSSA